MTPRLISTGSILVDLPMAVPGLPPRGGDVLGSVGARTPGGGFNIVAAAARQGATVLLAGVIGTGDNATACQEQLAAEGITHCGRIRSDADTGLCVTLTEPDGERTFISAPGAESRLEPGDLPDCAQPRDSVFVSGYDLCYPQAGPELAAWCARLPAQVTLLCDPGPLVADIPAELWHKVLDRTDVLSVNEREAHLLTGIAATASNFAATAAALAALVPGRLVLLRLGAAGCVLQAPGQMAELIPSVCLPVVDSTGAGDAHAGAFLARLLAGARPAEAVRAANIAAALTVSRFGPATSPTRSQVDALLL